jgi:hypothetical protein
MRSDRLKQVMQEIDSTFDEKNLGISKFSRFCQEAAQRGLLSVTKLENGQLEVDLPAATPGTAGPVETADVEATPVADAAAPVRERDEERGSRRRRGRGGRGRDREDRPREPREEQPIPQTTIEAAPAAPEAEVEIEVAPVPAPVDLASETRAQSAQSDIGTGGERLTRAEAFDLVRRTVADLAAGDNSVRASAVRARARELLGRDSESLSDRMFVRILKDAHDEGLIDLRRRGNDFEVAPAAEAASVAEQVASNERATAAAAPVVPGTPAPRLGMRPRAVGGRGRATGEVPANLLAFGVVTDARQPAPVAPPVTPAPAPEAPAARTAASPAAPAKRGQKSARGKTAAKAAEPPKAKRAAKKTPSARAKGKKAASTARDE